MQRSLVRRTLQVDAQPDHANPAQDGNAAEEIAGLMAELAELAGRWPVLSEGERRRMLDEYAPRMAELLARHSAALAEVAAGG